VARRRTLVGLLGFIALEGAAFVRYTDVIVLACGVAAVLLVGFLSPGSLPRRALLCWVGSAAILSAFVLLFDHFVYGHALSSGYGPEVVTFGLGASGANLAHIPAHLTRAVPAFWLGLTGIAWIVVRDLRLPRSASTQRRPASLADARRDLCACRGSLPVHWSWWSSHSASGRSPPSGPAAS
jgi:energy-coupling factor transporter transmembrane protein EcfT